METIIGTLMAAETYLNLGLDLQKFKIFGEKLPE